MEGNGDRGLARPGEEELHVAGVMDEGSGVRAPAAQPFAESFDLGEHKNTS